MSLSANAGSAFARALQTGLVVLVGDLCTGLSTSLGRQVEVLHVRTDALVAARLRSLGCQLAEGPGAGGIGVVVRDRARSSVEAFGRLVARDEAEVRRLVRV